ncbi:unnamed protein product [Paramecium sonneborni]|uniref:Protein kinase domain-containing protein n=1 Tax=Paramecium sonneborni TaxID=65129 RepID=A0A8S1QXG9_9CILI|nr:unnamed protein product [Paramecium sonneborni]
MQDDEIEETVIDGWVIDTSVLLGQGTYGKVLRCHHQDEPDIVHCVKIISKMNINVRENNLTKTIQNEKSVVSKLANVNCENLVQIIQVIDKPKHVYIIMELCDHDLEKEFENIKPNWFSRKEQLDMIKQIINGACALRDNQLIHRDIKPQNILVKIVNQNGQQRKIYKLADFGFSRTLDNMYQSANLTLVGTWKYLAPEIYYRQQFSAMCDIYSYGLLFHQIAFKGKLPFNGDDQVKHYKNIETSNFKCQQLSGEYGDLITNLIERMIVFSQEQRINFEELKQHQISTLQINIPQESLFIPFNLRYNKEEIENQQIADKEKLWNGIYKILNIYYHKYLLCDHVRNHLKQKFQSPTLYILITQLFIGWIGFRQIKYAFSLIKTILTDIEEPLIKNNNVPLLISIIKNYCEQSQRTNKYSQLNSNINQIYYKFKNSLNQDYCEFLMKIYNHKDQSTIKNEANILKYLEIQNFDCQVISDKLDALLKTQILQKTYDQTDQSLIKKVVNLQKDFEIVNCAFIDVNKIFEQNNY